MEVDETQTQIQIQRQVSKFQRVSSNGSTTTTDNSSLRLPASSNNADDVAATTARLCGWPSSRIVRVSRASGGKDRHSKVLTSKGLRDRRVRLSVGTAIQFYDLQDRLGLDQPSKAVEWLLKAAASSIDELPSLDPPFAISAAENTNTNNNNNNNNGNSQACSSTSETSKGSGLSLSRSENRNKARERAREMKSNKDKEKEKEIDSPRVRVFKNPVNNTLSENSSFTDLLTGRSPMDYFYPRSPQPSPQFNNNNNYHNHQFSFLQDTFGGDGYNLNFAMTSSSTGAAPGGFGRGTLQSNLQSSVMPHHHHHIQSDGSTPFYIVPNATVDHYPAPGGYHINYGRSDNHKEKSKN